MSEQNSAFEDEIERVASEQFAPESVEAPADAEGSGEVGAADLEGLPDSAAPTPEQLEILGRQFPREDLESLLEFYDFARQNPQHMRAFGEYLEGRAQFVPAGGDVQVPPSPPVGATATPRPEVPDEDDLADLDPALRARFAKLDELEARFAQIDQANAQTRLNTAQSAVVKGGENFQSKFSLNDAEMEQLMGETAQLGILPALANASGDMISAVEEALETAYWRNAGFREREMSRITGQNAQQAQKARKASALTSQTGSTPRESAPPRSAEERDAAALEMIRADMFDR